MMEDDSAVANALYCEDHERIDNVQEMVDVIRKFEALIIGFRRENSKACFSTRQSVLMARPN